MSDPEQIERRAGSQRDDRRHHEISLQAVGRGFAPRKQRSDAGQKQQEDRDRNIDAIEEWSAHRDLVAVVPLRQDREHRAPQYGETGDQQHQVVKEEAALARDDGSHLAVGLQVGQAVENQIQRSRQRDDDKRHEVAADIGLREGMNGIDEAAARQCRSEDRHRVGCDDQHHIPDLQHAFLFLHHHRVKIGGADQPGHQRCVFDRIPRPVSAPAQFVISPVAAQQNSDRENSPGDHRPASRRTNPGVAELARDQGRDAERVRDGKTDQARVKHGRMNHHQRVLEQRIQAVAVSRMKQADRAAGQLYSTELERIHDEQMHRGKEERRAHQDCRDIRHHRSMLVPVLENAEGRIDRQDPGPEEQRTFLTAPHRTDFEVQWKVDAGVRRDVGNREVVGVEKISEGEDCPRNSEAIGDCCVAAARNKLVVPGADAYH